MALAVLDPSVVAVVVLVAYFVVFVEDPHPVVPSVVETDLVVVPVVSVAVTLLQVVDLLDHQLAVA